MLVEKDLALELGPLVTLAFGVFQQGPPSAPAQLVDFIYDRLAASLREQGYTAQEVDAVLALRPERLGEIPKRLAAVRAFAALPEAPALAAANKRIGNILKKAGQAHAHVNHGLLREAGEQALFAAMNDVAPLAAAE